VSRSCWLYWQARAEAAEADADKWKALAEELEAAGGGVAEALEVACRGMGEKNPRKTIPVLAAWVAASADLTAALKEGA